MSGKNFGEYCLRTLLVKGWFLKIINREMGNTPRTIGLGAPTITHILDIRPCSLAVLAVWTPLISDRIIVCNPMGNILKPDAKAPETQLRRLTDKKL